MQSDAHYPTKEEIDLLLSEFENSLPEQIVLNFKEKHGIQVVQAGQDTLSFLYKEDGQLTAEQICGIFTYMILKMLRVWQNENYSVIHDDENSTEEVTIMRLRKIKEHIMIIEDHNFPRCDKIWKEKFAKTVINFFIKSAIDLNLYRHPLHLNPRD
ncbi:MAG: hypothetical protein KBC98_01560 [Candidatus Pacebacteria bacterium]|nr:hypothetical protein [Candidatus Paceibacterota bacterium]